MTKGVYMVSQQVFRFIKLFMLRLKHDSIGVEAGALAYTTVLALVPAVTIVLSVFTMVPAFQPLKSELMNFVTGNFLPVFADAISDSITTFAEHAGSTTVTGALMLIVVSLMMIRAADKSLNRIWRGGRRKATMTFAIYWTMLTVGPLSFAVIIWISSQAIALKFVQEYELTFAVKMFYTFLPFLVEAALILALYTIMPVTDVRFSDAVIGAFTVAVMFEVLKKLFSVFIINFTSYEAIYGALAAAPVLMIWIYSNWLLVLMGAEFTSVLGIVRSNLKDNKTAEELYTEKRCNSSLTTDITGKLVFKGRQDNQS